MEIAALTVGLLAWVFALAARSTARSNTERIEELERDQRRRAENLAEELEQALETQRRLLAEVAEGKPVSRQQILEGRLWNEVNPKEGQAMVEAGSDLHILDVRTPGETAAGVLPNAQLIPVGELEERVREVPKDGKDILVYCAGGGRSAAACEFLSQQGYSSLHNLSGGYQSWQGPTARPGQEG